MKLTSLYALALSSVFLSGADWPQYRGPNHDGISTEKLLGAGKGVPSPVWKVPMTDGFSSLSVAGGKVFSLVLRQSEGADRETCVALDAVSGKELWAVPIGPVKINNGGDEGTSDNKGGDGPRSTPAVDGNRVYVLSARLVLSCLDAADGHGIWTKNLVAENGARVPGWENAASPLIDGDRVFVGGGGQGQSLMAFDKADGKIAWKTQDDRITHATPIAATLLGTRQVIFFTQTGLVSVRPESGEVLWRYKFDYRTSTAASPVVGGDIVYCSAGYGVGSGAARISKAGDQWVATELWRLNGNKPVANHWSTPVQREGYLYGMFGFKEHGRGPLKCVELATGKVMWEEAGFGPGNLISVGETLVALSDKGELVLVEATPKNYREISRTKAVSGKCWSMPAFADGKIYVRSTREGACLEVAGKVAGLGLARAENGLFLSGRGN